MELLNKLLKKIKLEKLLIIFSLKKIDLHQLDLLINKIKLPIYNNYSIKS